jgi:hypothetical protein
MDAVRVRQTFGPGEGLVAETLTLRNTGWNQSRIKQDREGPATLNWVSQSRFRGFRIVQNKLLEFRVVLNERGRSRYGRAA